MPNLRPCPFCGCSDVEYRYEDEGHITTFNVFLCRNCYAHTFWGFNERIDEDRAKRDICYTWNRRVSQ